MFKMSIRVNSHPNWSEHTISFFVSQKTVSVLASSVDPHENDASCGISSGSSLFAKITYLNVIKNGARLRSINP